jgi:hypothetical protein
VVAVWEADAGVRRAEFPIPGNAPIRLVFSPENRFLATIPNEQEPNRPDDPAHDRSLRIWELASGKVAAEYPVPPGSVLCLAFAPDLSAVYGGMKDSTVLAWPFLAAPTESPRPPPRLEALWADLAGDDAVRALQAMRHLRTIPNQATPFLIQQLRPAKGSAPKLRQMIDDLDHADFTRRDSAFKELERLVDLAEPALRSALQGDLPLERRRRVDVLLRKLPSTKPPDQIRAVRAVAVLEWLGSREGLGGLQALAQDAPVTWAGQEAHAALARLKR